MHGAASQKHSYGSFKNTECFGSISLNSQFFGFFLGGEGGMKYEAIVKYIYMRRFARKKKKLHLMISVASAKG